MSDSYVYTVVQLSNGQWSAETEVREGNGWRCLTRKSYSPTYALRQLIQAIDELEPLEAKIEEGEA